MFVAYPTESRLRSAILILFVFEILGCVYQWIAHVWWAAALNTVLACTMALIGLSAAYRKTEGALLTYAILEIIAVMLQLGNLVWIVSGVWLLSGPCTTGTGWHCHGWSHAHTWAFILFVLSVAATLIYLLMKIYAAALALRLRDQVHSAHIAEAFVAPRTYEAAYASHATSAPYQASQPSYQAPPRSPLVSRGDATTYGTASG